MKKKRADKPLELQLPEQGTKVLLHACCAPCSGAIVECMLNNGIRPTLFYSNPNIYPEKEYITRRDECQRFADSLGLEMVEDRYDHVNWLEYVAGLENEPERGKRCRRCFELRLSRATAFAHSHGFGLITSTLASSRWKNLDQITDAGLTAAAVYDDVTFWAQNWRKGGLTERRAAILRENNFYNQLYCGCEFSMNNKTEKNNDDK